ncbi:HCLS1-binding protein 3 [Myotis davidii]|uniref:HCLS1-binding protein 3 n=1 Tax=Myotis davidii TaxID=225400 RepID=L5LPK1_MYODS|nr:HCLS1-binding protein 3 [Myotis davidii]
MRSSMLSFSQCSLHLRWRREGRDGAPGAFSEGVGSVTTALQRVQNVHTGLDLAVPQHQEVRGKMMSGHVEYQILVVTRLAAFKSAKHRPEDVVQFLVSKKYSEIEEFYQKLSGRYPAASLPPLPRKVLFVGESDIRERRAVFHEILRCVSQDAELAASPELLEFLGTSSPGASDPSSRGVSVLDTGGQAGDDGEAFDFFQQQEGTERPPTPCQEEDAGKSSEEEEALDPLGIMRSKKPKKCPKVAAKPRPSPRLTLFDEEVDPDAGLFSPSRKLPAGGSAEDARPRDPLKLFDDPDLGGAVPLGDPLLLPAAPAPISSAFGGNDAALTVPKVPSLVDHRQKLDMLPGFYEFMVSPHHKTPNCEGIEESHWSPASMAQWLSIDL